jgi:hypothetical protein
LGQDVNFAVSATGMPSLIYHWYFWPSHGKPMLDWIPLTEVEGCEINIDAMRLEDVGIYKCFIEHRLQVRTLDVLNYICGKTESDKIIY